MQQMKMLLCVLLIAASALVAACSPEAARTRSGGPGADIGNRSANVDMHGNVYPSYQAPERGNAIQVQKANTK